jgi:nicotinamide-nucleotide amidase
MQRKNDYVCIFTKRTKKKIMDVEIITIGDELLIGQVVDTNSAWMGEQLEKEGFRVVWKTTVGDVERHITDAIDRAMGRAQVVLLTGGVGPTKDDVTRSALCRYFRCGLRFSEEVYGDIRRLFDRSGRAMNRLTHNQAMAPDACVVIRNLAGTAPCMWFERVGKALVAIPGVPYEMKWLMTNEILPRLRQTFHPDVYILHWTLWVGGYGESVLALHLERFERELPTDVKLAYLPQAGVVRLRLSVYADSAPEADKVMAWQKEKLRLLLAEHILTEEDCAPEELVGRTLMERGLTMGTAESCTGGRIASMITSVSGSSRYFAGGVVAYGNEVKSRLLGVTEESLREYGAVSRPVVEQMARKAISTLGCDCAVATSGIAGPEGETLAKPVGMVWIAAACRDEVVSACHRFGTLREANIFKASNTALLMLHGLLNK